MKLQPAHDEACQTGICAPGVRASVDGAWRGRHRGRDLGEWVSRGARGGGEVEGMVLRCELVAQRGWRALRWMTREGTFVTVGKRTR